MKKTILGFLGIVIMISLAGCSGKSASSTSNQNGQNFLNANPASIPIEQKTGIGILKLEGTDLAVTADQAKTLLPLWQALKTLSSDTNTTAEEITALNKQIEGALTDKQIQTIKDMTWTSDDLRQLFRPSGGNGSGGNGTNGQATPSQGSSTQGSSTQSSNGRRTNGGFQGGPPEGFGGGGFFGPGGANGAQNPAASRTPVPGQAERRAAGGMNLMFVDQVIQLLQGKIKG